jgi:large subunit ribosomal protein L25
MSNQVEVAAEKREIIGKQVKQLRSKGLVPCVLYGHNEPSLPLQVEGDALEKAFKRSGTSSIFSLKVGSGRPSMALVKQVQYHPTKGYLQHVDFLRVAAREKIKTRVPLRFVGEAPAAKESSLIVMRAAGEVMVECLPGDLPQALDVDLSVLEEAGSAIRVADLDPGPKVTIVTDPHELVVSIAELRAEPETVAPEEAEEAAEAEAAEQPEGEAAEQPAAGEAEERQE